MKTGLGESPELQWGMQCKHALFYCDAIVITKQLMWEDWDIKKKVKENLMYGNA